MSPGTTFERVYRSLKEQLGSGTFRPGEPLEPRALSDSLNSSITPVRDALHRLVGERLVEAPRGSGFRAPTVTEVGLRSLYALNQVLLLIGASVPTAQRAGETRHAPAERPLTRTEALFEAIAARTGNPEHVDAVAALSERLRPVRRVEDVLLASATEELEQMEAQLMQDDRQGLKASIRAYHRRRERAAAALVADLLRR